MLDLFLIIFSETNLTKILHESVLLIYPFSNRKYIIFQGRLRDI